MTDSTYYVLKLLPLLLLLIACSGFVYHSFRIRNGMNIITRNSVIFEESFCSVKFISSKQYGAYMGLCKMTLSIDGYLFIRPPFLLLPFFPKTELYVLNGVNINKAKKILFDEVTIFPGKEKRIIIEYLNEEGKIESLGIKVKNVKKCLTLLNQFVNSAS